MSDEVPKRRWYRFSLKTLFLVQLICACGLGWFGATVHARRVAEAERAEKQALAEAKQALATEEYYRTQALKHLAQQRERQRALKLFPGLASIESAGIFVHYHQGRAALLNFCNIPHTDDAAFAIFAAATVSNELSALTTLSLERTQVTEKTIRLLGMFIAVGTAVAGGPPHRSVREGLPHTAPALSRARNRTLG